MTRDSVIAVVGYVGLGANVGDRGRTLLAAAKLIDAVEGVEVRRLSQAIETEPQGGPPDQGRYLNAVVEISTVLSPAGLLSELQAIERALGRDRAAEVRWGPRTCDLDILLLGDLVVQTPELIVPHPRMHLRRFVLEPLATLAPQAMHPVLRKTAAAMLEELGQ